MEQIYHTPDEVLVAEEIVHPYCAPQALPREQTDFDLRLIKLGRPSPPREPVLLLFALIPLPPTLSYLGVASLNCRVDWLQQSNGVVPWVRNK